MGKQISEVSATVPHSRDKKTKKLHVSNLLCNF